MRLPKRVHSSTRTKSRLHREQIRQKAGLALLCADAIAEVLCACGDVADLLRLSVVSRRLRQVVHGCKPALATAICGDAIEALLRRDTVTAGACSDQTESKPGRKPSASPNPVRALTRFCLAGNAEAAVFITTLLLQSVGTMLELKSTLALLDTACDQGHPNALYLRSLALAWWVPSRGAAMNERAHMLHDATHMLLRAAKAGHLEARVTLQRRRLQLLQQVEAAQEATAPSPLPGVTNIAGTTEEAMAFVGAVTSAPFTAEFKTIDASVAEAQRELELLARMDTSTDVAWHQQLDEGVGVGTAGERYARRYTHFIQHEVPAAYAAAAHLDSKRRQALCWELGATNKYLKFRLRPPAVRIPGPKYRFCCYEGCGNRELCTTDVKVARKAHGRRRHGFLLCSHCRIACYCSAACQMRDWSLHKVHCEASQSHANNTDNDNDALVGNDVVSATNTGE